MIVSLRDIRLDYTNGSSSGVSALRSISLDIAQGSFCALVGASGSGKTSLMNIIGLLDQPSGGRYWLGAEQTSGLPLARRAALRNRSIGFVFQSFHLLPQFTALDNVGLPLIYRGLSRRKRAVEASRLLERVGLGGLGHRRPAELSGGQRQRVAIARALVGTPPLILADEPTGNLDSRAAGSVMALLHDLNREEGLTILMVTHDPALAQQCDVRFAMRDGLLAEDAPLRGAAS